MVVRIDALLLRSLLVLLFLVGGWEPALAGASAALYPDAAALLAAGRWAEAKARAKETLRRAQAAHDTVTLYQSYGHLGRAYRMLGHPEAALTAYRKALDGAAQAGDKAHQTQYAYQIGVLRRRWASEPRKASGGRDWAKGT